MEKQHNIQKPFLEQIVPAFGSSFLVRRYNNACENTLANWHFHPEIELIYVQGGSGKRHIGQHMSYFNNGDLVLMGSYLPHYGFTDRLTGNKSETVIQFKEQFLGDGFFEVPEMSAIKQLLDLSKKGIAFDTDTKKRVGKQIEALTWKDQFGRLLGLLEILKILSESRNYEILNAQGVAIAVNAKDNDRMNEIYAYVRNHFKSHISLDEISEVAHMTVPAFCRYFKKIARKTFTQFVNEYRIVHASKLLAETSMTITEVSFESGFNNFSHFNKLFKQFTSKSPSHYRKGFKRVIDE